MNIDKRQIAYNRSKRSDGIKYILIHDTGNSSKGADAESHFKYFNSADRQSSADFFVDDKKILQANDYLKYYTWHCGDGKGKYGITNKNSIGIEICVNTDSDYDKAFNSAVELTKYLMEELNIPIDRVLRHYDASRKNCPQSMKNNDWALWKKFKDLLLVNDKGCEEAMTKEEKEKLVNLENEVLELKKNKEKVYHYFSELPDWAYDTVKKLYDRGIYKGNSANDLNLPETLMRVLVINDRAGIYK